jgi:hypothetical protein
MRHVAMRQPQKAKNENLTTEGTEGTEATEETQPYAFLTSVLSVPSVVSHDFFRSSAGAKPQKNLTTEGTEEVISLVSVLSVPSVVSHDFCFRLRTIFIPVTHQHQAHDFAE